MSSTEQAPSSSPSFLASWTSRVTQYSQFFQVHQTGARDDLGRLGASPLTNWKDVSKMQGRYAKLDSLELRRQLGEITQGEVAEVNRVFGGNPVTGYLFTRGSSEPALLCAWHKGELVSFSGASFAIGLYGRFVRGYNNLWLVAPLLPIAMMSAAMTRR